MKIIGFAQLRNELEKGNLINWFKSMTVCDYIYIFDQDSIDGSKEYYKKFDNTVVLESPINDFANEIKCKDKLLERLLKDHPDVDWIFWMDGDTILDGRLQRENNSVLKDILEDHSEKNDIDAIAFGHLNLWRSDTFYRIDSLFHWLNDRGVCAIWKNNGNLKFNPIGGLHREQYPNGIEKGVTFDYSLIHRGFSTDEQIINRIKYYQTIPDKVWDKGEKHHLKGEVIKAQTIERFLNEEALEVRKIQMDILPDWFVLKDAENPKNKRKIREIYEEGNRNNSIDL